MGSAWSSGHAMDVSIPQGISLASRLLVYKVEVQKELAVYSFDIDGA